MEGMAQEAAARQAADQARADALREKLMSSAPQHRAEEPAVDPAYAERMEKERAAFARRSESRAKVRNENRTWWEKLFRLREVTPKMMEEENAQETYTMTSNLRRNPKVYAGGRSGPQYNTMARAMNRGANDSRLSEVAEATSPEKAFGESWINLDEKDVAREVERRREQGLPTDVLNRDIEFAEAQRKEKEDREKDSGLRKAA